MKPLRILHCPTMTRGNPYGLARAEHEVGLQSWSLALERTEFDFPVDERLKREGMPIELLLVENVPFAEAQRMYRRADLLVDQLLVGLYGGL